ncbi:hypothetical protein [Streptomyces sp. NRRL S-646]|nr:hypothetical protein [Streptomyces sp. NRRL S-646]
MIRIRIAQAAAVVTLVMGTATLFPSPAHVVVVDSAAEPLFPQTGTWGG